MTARKWRDGQAVELACALIGACPERYHVQDRTDASYRTWKVKAAQLGEDVQAILDALPETIPDADPERVRPTFGTAPVGFSIPDPKGSA